MPLLKWKLAGQVGAHYRLSLTLLFFSRQQSHFHESRCLFKLLEAGRFGDAMVTWHPTTSRHESRRKGGVQSFRRGIRSYCSCPMVAPSSHYEVRTAFFGPAKPQFVTGLHPQAHTRIHLQITRREHLRHAMPFKPKSLHYVSTHLLVLWARASQRLKCVAVQASGARLSQPQGSEVYAT